MTNGKYADVWDRQMLKMLMFKTDREDVDGVEVVADGNGLLVLKQMRTGTKLKLFLYMLLAGTN